MRLETAAAVVWLTVIISPILSQVISCSQNTVLYNNWFNLIFSKHKYCINALPTNLELFFFFSFPLFRSSFHVQTVSNWVFVFGLKKAFFQWTHDKFNPKWNVCQPVGRTWIHFWFDFYHINQSQKWSKIKMAGCGLKLLYVMMIIRRYFISRLDLTQNQF